MRYLRIELKEKYCFLGEGKKNPLLRCYLPSNLEECNRQDEKRPSIVICPGGAYAFCSEREAEPIALKFASWGFNAFVLNYSVAPNRYPTQLREVAAVFEELYKNADDWHCDTQKIGILGFSAGGHLAAHYSNAYGTDNVRKVFPNSKKPNFSVLCYPVITADPTFAHKGSIENLLGEYPVGKETDEFSCEKLVTADTPPTFIWHTAQDTAVPPKNSLCYAMALSENNIPFSLHIYPYGCHGLATVDSLTNGELDRKTLLANEWFYELKKWMDNTI